MTITVDKLGRRHPGMVSSEERERRRTAWREYVSAHPDLTFQTIRGDKQANDWIRQLYQSKVERALYDAITDGKAPNEVPADHFRPLVSYKASKIRYFLQRSNMPVPPLFEDMIQDGLVGVLKAQAKVDTSYSLKQIMAFFTKTIKRDIWDGLENACKVVNLPNYHGTLTSKLAFLCRYGLSAAEARKIKGEEFFENSKNETVDRLARIYAGSNIGLKTLRNVPSRSEEAYEEEISSGHQAREFLMNALSSRDREIFLCHLQGQTQRAISRDKKVTPQRIGQLNDEAVKKLRQRMKHLLAMEDPYAIRLYREYFAK